MTDTQGVMLFETKVIQYLAEELHVPVGAQTPAGPPEKYVVIERTGGGRKDGLLFAVLAMRCTAPSLYGAAALSRHVISAMRWFPCNSTNVFSAFLESEYNQTDTRTKEYRYTCVFRVFYLEDEA